MNEPEPARPPAHDLRKPYVPPRVVEYGSVAKLSSAKTGPNADGAGMKNCL